MEKSLFETLGEALRPKYPTKDECKCSKIKNVYQSNDNNTRCFDCLKVVPNSWHRTNPTNTLK